MLWVPRISRSFEYGTSDRRRSGTPWQRIGATEIIKFFYRTNWRETLLFCFSFLCVRKVNWFPSSPQSETCRTSGTSTDASYLKPIPFFRSKCIRRRHLLARRLFSSILWHSNTKFPLILPKIPKNHIKLVCFGNFPKFCFFFFCSVSFWWFRSWNELFLREADPIHPRKNTKNFYKSAKSWWSRPSKIKKNKKINWIWPDRILK